MRALGSIGVGFMFFVIAMSVLGAANVIDFKVCITDAGRCHMTVDRKE